MGTYLKVLVFLFIASISFVPCVISQLELPSVACPNLFQYIPHGRGYIGKVILDDVPFDTLSLVVTFSQKQTIRGFLGGRLTFENDLVTVQKDFEAANPITFKVTFPSANEVPMLIRIKMNGEIICSAKTPKAHKVVYSLQRNFTPTEGSSRIPKTTPTTTTSITSTTTTTTTIRTTSFETTEKPFMETFDSLLCGISPFKADKLPKTSTDDVRGWFPWITKVSLAFGDICEGSLISTQTVITTTSCFHNARFKIEEIQIMLGVFGVNKQVLSYPIKRGVKTILLHPEYNQTKPSDADIALLRLDRPVSLNRYVFPICLWNELQDTKSIVGEQAYIPYKKDDDHVLTVLIGSDENCSRLHAGSIESLPPRTLCVVTQPVDGLRYSPYPGSSLVMNRNGQWTLRAILSSCVIGSKGCNLDRNFIFADVARFNLWIRYNMWI